MTKFSVELAEAYRAHYAALYRVAYARLYGAHLQDQAEDVLSAVILELLERDNPPEIRNWEAFLVTMVTRRAIDLVRSAEVRHRDGSLAELDAVPDHHDSYEEVDSDLDTLGAIRAATQALDELDEPMQTVARKHLWQGRPQKDIAAEMGVTQARISQIVKNARSEIAQRVKGVE